MGREISSSHFQHTDFHQFERHLAQEMALLHEYFRNDRFSTGGACIGVELEMWLTNSDGEPEPRNVEFLRKVDSPDVVPELAKFNVEFNVPYQRMRAGGLGAMERELSDTWECSSKAAREMGLNLVAVGILPTIQPEHLSLETMSEMSRFRALNEQVRRLRKGRPIPIRIQGEEHLEILHDDVMFEAAATSLQVHYQIPPAHAVRYYNAALIASGPILGLTANSPYLFGKRLWCESRIPLFETSINLGGPFPRVSFGSGYALSSLEEIFLENRSCHSVLLPIELDEPPEMLPHVRLHNGTIWRWNRPLIGFDETGQPHLRIEHRIMPAGPSLLDMLSNIAFATGLIHSLAMQDVPPESLLPFADAEANFQSAARLGMAAGQHWLNGEEIAVVQLLEQLLPVAAKGLRELDIDEPDIQKYLTTIEQRIANGRNGAVWQTEFVSRHGRDFAALTRAYTERQQSGSPVHEWTF